MWTPHRYRCQLSQRSQTGERAWGRLQGSQNPREGRGRKAGGAMRGWETEAGTTLSSSHLGPSHSRSRQASSGAVHHRAAAVQEYEELLRHAQLQWIQVCSGENVVTPRLTRDR